jgi:hypothetical protein
MDVLNKHHGNIPKDAIYIGRGSPWGNPYKIGAHGSRDQVIELYEKYAREKLLINPTWLDPLIGHDLICFCAPRACHGDVLIKLLEERKI